MLSDNDKYMTINTKTVIKTPEGESYKDGESDLTIGRVIASTLLELQ